MGISIEPFDFARAAARAGLRTDGLPLQPAGAAPVQGPADFRAAMDQALKAVSQAQAESTDMQRELQLENPSISLEQTMIAMQKASLGFQSVLAVRNRLVQAYSDIMNMQV